MGAVFDIPELMDRVKQLMAEYRKKPVLDVSEIDIPILNDIRPLIRQCVCSNIVSDPAIWAEYKIRVVYRDPKREFGGCFCKAFKEKDPTVLGQGVYGKVFSTHKYPCAHAPPDGTPVAIKVEQIRTTSSWDMMYQLPVGVRQAIDITKKATELGISPALYDTFVCISPDQTIHIVKIMELFDGKPINMVEWTSAKNKQAAQKMLRKKIETLNKNGIIHNDLHGGNVMVKMDKNGRVDRMVIIDFDRAKLANTFEAKSASDIIQGTNEDPLDLANDNRFVNFALDRLLKADKIILSRPSVAIKSKKRKTQKKLGHRKAQA